MGDIDYLRNAEPSLNSALATQADRATFVGTCVVTGSGKPLRPHQYGQIAMAATVRRALG
ncbi:hypothetical protein ACFTWS_05370 [Streptomyces sp. NPDC057027]|uniref:hypothetical protein n=1 Tax=Streptomyces sp. NPDC057027 TaxID=3346004 RepID=UPI00363D1E7B